MSVVIGAIAFSVGLTLTVLYGVSMYYFETHYFYRFRDAVGRYFSRQIDWCEFNRKASAPDKYKTCECLAWLSGACGIVGVIAAIIAIT